jgi:bifunctional enzyme CysN/CysC
VDRIVTYDLHVDGHVKDLDRAEWGQAVTITLDREVDVTRGDVITGLDQDSLEPADRFAVDMVWLGEEPLAHGRSYLLISGSRTVPATVTNVRHKMDVVTGHHDAARILEMNDIGRVEVATDKPVPLDTYAVCRDTGGFLLVDRVTADTVAAGMVVHSMRRSANVKYHDYAVDHEARRLLMGHDAKVVWLTGLSGAGKSTIADAAVRKLHSLGVHTYVLDGDNVRHGLNKDLGFTPEDRAENVRRVAEVSKLMRDSGIVVLVALVSPFAGDRRAAKELFEPGEFLEVFIDTPLAVAQARDPKGLYAKAAAGNLPNMTGVGQEYEVPTQPDLVLAGNGDLDTAVDELVKAILGE